MKHRPQSAGGSRRPRSVLRLPAVALVTATLTLSVTAEAGGRHHGRHHGGEGAALFALGSVLAFLAVAHARPAPVLHSPRDHGWHGHGHRSHYHHHHGAYWHRHGHRDGQHRHVDRRAAHAPRVLSDRHRHGNAAWHTHPLEHPRAFHRH